MYSPGRPRRTASLPVVLAIAGLPLALAALVVLSIHDTGDYHAVGPVGGNNTGPGLMALLHGNLAGYVSHQPVIGLTSIVLRLPFTAVASAVGAGPLGVYQAGALACVLPLVLFGGWLVAAPGLELRQRLTRLLALLLVIQSPILRNEIGAGHPEGTVAFLCAVLAVMAAAKGRAGWAGLLLGLAVSSKETGLIALPTVMVVLPHGRRRTLAIAGAIVVAFCGWVWLADPDALRQALHGEGATHYLTPFSLLWPVAGAVRVGGALSVARQMPLGLTRTGASVLALSVIGAAAAWWYVGVRKRGAVCNPLALLVLVGALRCACDSTHETYYWMAVLIPMAAWEATENRLPVGTALLSLFVSVLYGSLGRVAPVSLYLDATVAELLLIVYLAREAMPLPAPRASAGRQRILGSMRSAWRMRTGHLIESA